MTSRPGFWRLLARGTVSATCLAAAFSTVAIVRKRRGCGSHLHPSPAGLPDNLEIRRKLPSDLASWRLVQVKGESDAEVWHDLNEFFVKSGYIPWTHTSISSMTIPSATDIVSNGAGYAPLERGWGQGTPLSDLYHFQYPHPSCQAAQAVDGRSVIIRVLAIGGQGREHIQILRMLARGPCNLATQNHTIPLLQLLDFEDITFGVFPRIAAEVADSYDAWPENSVGDILDMVMQCLEALGFLHGMGVAHRDAFKDNFLVQWHPESMRVDAYPISRPRVYLNDFETAVRFLPNVSPEERVCVGLPLGASFPDPERYRRPVPPEVASGEPYDPFKLDVWQFTTSFADFKNPRGDRMMELLRDPDPSKRPDANEAAAYIAWSIGDIPPHSLLYPPAAPDKKSSTDYTASAVDHAAFKDCTPNNETDLVEGTAPVPAAHGSEVQEDSYIHAEATSALEHPFHGL
ncbi:hypothetical protein C8Q77DRAFT_1269334 [Trametes polyzona]|nr:hypothetical protein C8Q77DRAFT_1269334 [Trametes polyzona]